MSPSPVSAAMVCKSAHLAGCASWAFQPRGEQAVDGGKPEQRGKERRLEHKHPAIAGSDQPGHAAAENQLENFAALFRAATGGS